MESFEDSPDANRHGGYQTSCGSRWCLWRASAWDLTPLAGEKWQQTKFMGERPRRRCRLRPIAIGSGTGSSRPAPPPPVWTRHVSEDDALLFIHNKEAAITHFVVENEEAFYAELLGTMLAFGIAQARRNRRAGQASDRRHMSETKRRRRHTHHPRRQGRAGFRPFFSTAANTVRQRRLTRSPKAHGPALEDGACRCPIASQRLRQEIKRILLLLLPCF